MNRNELLLSLLLLFALAAISNPSVQAQQTTPVKIYLAADDHTDYFWTADDVEYRAAFIEMLDYYLDRIDECADEPLEFQTKWNCDGSLWLWEYEHGKTKEEFARLMSRVSDGHISSPLNALVSTYGGQPAEAVLRGMYYAGDLERRFDVRFPLAVAMENQTLPLGLGALWAGAGAKYSWRGICGCATKMPYPPFQKRDHEIYWWRGLDDSRILMKWYSLGNSNESIGGYAEARKPDQAIDFVTGNQDFLKRHPFATVGLFGQGWDDLKTLDNSFPSIARRRTTRDQKVIVSNEADFFRDFERRHGGNLPVLTEAYGNEWDILPASMAEQTARVRRAVERLRTAEAMAAIVLRHDPDFWQRRKSQRDLAHLNLGLYWEHDWTSDANETMREKRAVWQRRLADQISGYVDELLAAARVRLASLVENKTDRESSTKSFLIFNPIGWQRTATVSIDGYFPSEVKVVDANTNVEVDHHRVSQHQVIALVKDIPAIGFTTLNIGPTQASLVLDSPDKNSVENEHFKISIDNGGEISSVVDKASGRELVGSGGFNKLMRNGNPVTSEASVSVKKLGGISQRIEILRTSPIKSQTVISLTNDPSIGIENKILQNFSQTLGWSFDFKIEDFRLQHEEVGAIVTADLVSKGGHYANRNARYDWLSAGHFLRLHEKEFGIEIANQDCSFFQFGRSTPRKLDTSQPRVQFLIGGQIDGPDLGIRHQHGDRLFTQRFSIRTSGSSKTQSQPASKTPMAWAIEQTNPPVVIELPPNADGKLPQKFSMFAVDTQRPEVDNDSNVVLWSLKPAESGAPTDLIARWWNVADHDQRVALKCDGLRTIQPTSHIETDFNETDSISPDSSQGFVLPFSKQQMRTFRLKFAPSSN